MNPEQNYEQRSTPGAVKTYSRRSPSSSSSSGSGDSSVSRLAPVQPLLSPIVSLSLEEEQEMCRRIRMSIKKGSSTLASEIVSMSTYDLIHDIKDREKKKSNKISKQKLISTSMEKSKVALRMLKHRGLQNTSLRPNKFINNGSVIKKNAPDPRRGGYCPLVFVPLGRICGIIIYS